MRFAIIIFFLNASNGMYLNERIVNKRLRYALSYCVSEFYHILSNTSHLPHVRHTGVTWG